MNPFPLDVLDQLNATLEKLEALLAVASEKSFFHYNEAIKINYLWACHSLAHEAKRLVQTELEPQEVTV